MEDFTILLPVNSFCVNSFCVNKMQNNLPYALFVKECVFSAWCITKRFCFHTPDYANNKYKMALSRLYINDCVSLQMQVFLQQPKCCTCNFKCLEHHFKVDIYFKHFEYTFTRIFWALLHNFSSSKRKGVRKVHEFYLLIFMDGFEKRIDLEWGYNNILINERLNKMYMFQKFIDHF